MTKKITAHDWRTTNIKIGLLLLLAFIGLLAVSCKKTTTLESKPVPKYWKVLEFDLDGQTTSTPIFWNNTSTTQTNDWDDSDGWEHWSAFKRKQWCDQHTPLHQRHYCQICSTSPLCSATPVIFISYSYSNGIVKWETSTEQNVDYYSIQGSFDGKVFTEVGQLKPKGPSMYSYSIK